MKTVTIQLKDRWIDARSQPAIDHQPGDIVTIDEQLAADLKKAEVRYDVVTDAKALNGK